MKIVVLDGYTLNPGDLSWKAIENFGDLVVYDRTSFGRNDDDLILDRIRDADIVFTNKTPLSENVIKKAGKLRYIGVLATGYDVVDVKAASQNGIAVTNIPSYGTATVSQMAIALLLEVCHHVGVHDESVHRGEWANSPDWCYWHYPIIELAGKTMGIIGYGRIGQSTGKVAQAFGMNVLAYNPSKNKSLENETMKYAGLDELLSSSDVIVLHCPSNESTKGMINKNSIVKMKDGVIIINNSRGALIVEEDLAEALNSGKVAGAAVDVVSSEPIKEDNVLLKAKNCIITPHISWASKEARQRIMDMAADSLARFLSGNPINVVNK
ncbi:D-2-hydroxyacid dehydrogenase [Lutispora saccharofermentans]|uniref:D-2-hydroxyacid dehydrogenase n=1 Tax=Lutispora saccharofermentans TaxID=3024236 RepID=A0ABT1NG41_9FIRM|nr:D-2-hydroxyacid dehydrogenase [Lutispora saccharofermentans]MCQ1530222.1 D-2-hydroxyacid dehydrogenase [Lutispora saccharofermentans]